MKSNSPRSGKEPSLSTSIWVTPLYRHPKILCRMLLPLLNRSGQVTLLLRLTASLLIMQLTAMKMQRWMSWMFQPLGCLSFISSKSSHHHQSLFHQQVLCHRWDSECLPGRQWVRTGECEPHSSTNCTEPWLSSMLPFPFGGN